MALTAMTHRLLKLESDRLEQREISTPSYPADKQSTPTYVVGITPSQKPFTTITNTAPTVPSHLSVKAASSTGPQQNSVSVQSQLSVKQQPTTPSAEINKEALDAVEVVVSRYKKLAGKDSTAGKFACKLAQEAYFGTEVMKKCTCNGHADKQSARRGTILLTVSK